MKEKEYVEMINRVQDMEQCLNNCRAVTDELAGKVEDMDQIRDDMIRLFRYYGSEDWYHDREADLPADLPAGVLSEDLVYDLITDVRDLAFKMLEQATEILKERV